MSKRRKRLEEFAAHRSKPVLIVYFALRLIVGALLVAAYCKTIAKKGSLDKE